jgi:hypothetical protein
MAGMLRILTVGSKELRELVRDALLFRRHSHLLVANDYWELCSLRVGDAEQVSVAVIDLFTSDRELRRRTAEHIRRRWPNAQILLVGPEAEVPEDPLYDERIPTGLEAAELLAAMEWPVTGKQRSMRARKHDPDVVIQSGLNPGERAVVEAKSQAGNKGANETIQGRRRVIADH